MEVSSLFPQNRLAFANSSQTTFWQSSSLFFICNHGDGGDRGHRCTRQHLLGIVCGAGGCVSSSLLPPSRLPAAVWLQVCTWPHSHSLRIKQGSPFQHFVLSHGNNGNVYFNHFFYLLFFSVFQTYSGSDRSDGDSEWTVRAGAGWCCYH